MSNISPFNPSVSAYDRGELERFNSRTSEKREALQSSESSNLELSLTTKDGDVVTLAAGSFMDFASSSYDKSGKVSNGYETASAKVSSREMTLTSGSQFSFSVQGSLSEDELNDIENIVKTLDEVFYEMSTGDMDEAMGIALEMGEGYDTVSEFNADLSYSSSYKYEKEIASQAYYGGLEKGMDPHPAPSLNSRMEQDASLKDEGLKDASLMDLLKNSSSRLLDMMLEEFDKMQEDSQKKIPRRAAEPVDQLLARHMEAFNKIKDKGDKNGMDEKGGFDTILNELDNARKGMKKEFQKMMSSDMPDSLIV